MKKIFTESMLEFIRNNAANLKDKELAAALTTQTGEEVKLNQVKNQRRRLGLEKVRGRKSKLAPAKVIENVAVEQN